MRRNWLVSSSGVISSHLWVLSLKIASSGANTLATFLKYPCLGPQMNPSAKMHVTWSAAATCRSSEGSRLRLRNRSCALGARMRCLTGQMCCPQAMSCTAQGWCWLTKHCVYLGVHKSRKICAIVSCMAHRMPKRNRGEVFSNSNDETNGGLHRNKQG